MISIRSTKEVILRKGATGLDFEVKGGIEHGIPIVISRVQAGGVADGEMDVGDEIMAVNSKSLRGLKHSDAVHVLKSEGPVVALTIRSNPILRDMFAEDNTEDTMDDAGNKCDHMEHKPIPQGWSEKIDIHTGRPYFECHYTETTSWTDPRSLPSAIPLEAFDWTALPPGWEKHRNNHGTIYYINHDTQTSYWDSPVGVRQHRHKLVLQEHIEQMKRNMEELERELTEKRNRLLTLDKELETDDDNAPDDIMLLDSEVEQLDDHLTSMRRQLKYMADLSHQAQLEEVNDQKMDENCHRYARELVRAYGEFKDGQSQLHKYVEKAENTSSGMGLAYLLQLPPLQCSEEICEIIPCLHLLPDKITGKTSLELAVEVKLLTIGKQHLSELQRLLRLQTSHGHQIGDMVEEITKVELPKDDWINLSFREKLHKWTDCI